MAGTCEAVLPDENTSLSDKYETPMGLAHGTTQELKDRIKLHYDLASDHYLNLWGEHIHHGYWPTDESKANDSKDVAQVSLIRLLLDMSAVGPGARVLDVGCGIGGTARYLAAELGCVVTGITLSGKQVEIANRLSEAEAAAAKVAGAKGDEGGAAGNGGAPDADGFFSIGSRGGKVKFMELDAEKIGDVFGGGGEKDAAASAGTLTVFDAVWISEALSHFPDQALFFRNAFRVLRPGGKLALADWFKAEGLSEKQFANDIKPIEDGMLLPSLCTQPDYVKMATDAGLKIREGGPKDISKHVSKTWDITWALVQNPSLWAFALSHGRDGIAFLQAFRAMRRGYANESFRYAVMAFDK